MKVVRLSALRTDRLYPPGRIPDTHFVLEEPGALVWPQGLSELRRCSKTAVAVAPWVTCTSIWSRVALCMLRAPVFGAELHCACYVHQYLEPSCTVHITCTSIWSRVALCMLRSETDKRQVSLLECQCRPVRIRMVLVDLIFHLLRWQVPSSLSYTLINKSRWACGINWFKQMFASGNKHVPV